MSENIQEMIQSQAKKAKSAMRVLSRSSADIRNNALLAMAESLRDSKDKIQAANRIDLENGEKNGCPRTPHGTPLDRRQKNRKNGGQPPPSRCTPRPDWRNH